MRQSLNLLTADTSQREHLIWYLTTGGVGESRQRHDEKINKSKAINQVITTTGSLLEVLLSPHYPPRMLVPLVISSLKKCLFLSRTPPTTKNNNNKKKPYTRWEGGDWNPAGLIYKCKCRFISCHSETRHCK